MIRVSNSNATPPPLAQSKESLSPLQIEDFSGLLSEKEALSTNNVSQDKKSPFVSQLSSTHLPLKTKIDKSKVDPQILKAAQGMEAVFLNTMIESMRKTVPENELSMNNHATEIYRSMLDNEMAQKVSQNNSVGLSDLIIDYLESHRYNK